MSRYVSIDFERCKGCWLCIAHCPNELFHIGNKKNSMGYPVIEMHNQEYCMGNDCLACIETCPDNALLKPEEKPDKIAGKFYWLGNKISRTKKFIEKKTNRHEK